MRVSPFHFGSFVLFQFGYFAQGFFDLVFIRHFGRFPFLHFLHFFLFLFGRCFHSARFAVGIVRSATDQLFDVFRADAVERHHGFGHFGL